MRSVSTLAEIIMLRAIALKLVGTVIVFALGQ